MPASLHIMASRVVKRALAAGAVVDPVEHFADIQELDRLARAIACPPIAENLDLLDAPIVIDDVSLRRLSWAAREWLATDAWNWWQSDAPMLDLAYAWAMAHARDKASLQKVRHNEREAAAEVTRWARGTTANYEAVMAACRYLRPSIPPPTKRQTEDEDSNYIGSAMLTLLSNTSHPLDYWIFDAPSELVESTLARIREKMSSDRNSLMRALGKDIPPDPYSWHVRATERFSKAARAFVEKLTGKAAVGLTPSVNDSPGVHGGAQVDEGDVTDSIKDEPGGNPAGKEKSGADIVLVRELGPAGNQQ